MAYNSLQRFGALDNHPIRSDIDLRSTDVFGKQKRVVVAFSPTILADLYKATPQTIDAYRKIFYTLRSHNQLFIPDEVIRTFWAERPTSIEEAHNKYASWKGQLSESKSSISEVLRNWSDLHNEFVADAKSALDESSEIDDLDFAGLCADIQKQLEKLMAFLDEDQQQLPAPDPAQYYVGAEAWKTNDSIVQLLDKSFAGCVGEPMSAEEVSAILKATNNKDLLSHEVEAEFARFGIRPYTATEPGKQKANNATEKRAFILSHSSKVNSRDDITFLLVWRQLKDYAARLNTEDLNLVWVASQRESYWWRSTDPINDKGGKSKDRYLVGGRYELMKDYRSIVPNGVFYVWSPDVLMDRLRNSYELDISQTTIDNVQKAETSLSSRYDEKDELNRSIEDKDNSTDLDLVLRRNGFETHAKYVTKSGTVRVSNGAKMRSSSSRLPKKARELRKTLIGAHVVDKSSEDDEVYSFLRGYSFEDPEIAASVLLGERARASSFEVLPNEISLEDFIVKNTDLNL